MAIPPVATTWWLRGLLGTRRRPEVEGRRAVAPDGHRPGPAAVLFDRDGTLVVDVPYNGDPDAVVPVPGIATWAPRSDSALRAERATSFGP